MSATITDLSSIRPLAESALQRSAIGRCLANVASQVTLHVRRLEKGEYLIRAGDAFTSLYLLVSGSAKALRLGADGREQVTRFYLAEDVLGLDGMGTDVYPTSVRMLEYSTVVEIPLRQFERLGIDVHELYGALLRKLACEVVHDEKAMLLLGSANAEERLASFLLELGRSYAERGYSGSEYVLRMTREDIASYLGLKLETVSRRLSRFHREGALQVDGRCIRIRDREQLLRAAAWIDDTGLDPQLLAQGVCRTKAR